MASNNQADLIWKIADITRGVYKPVDYHKVILPFVVLRRLDCVLETTKSTVLDLLAQDSMKDVPEAFLLNKIANLTEKNAGEQISFFNRSFYTLTDLLSLPSADLRANLLSYIKDFSSNVEDILESLEVETLISKLSEKDLLYSVLESFVNVDLHPNKISNYDMGQIFEEIIRKFTTAQASDNGEFFTPRDAIELATALLFADDEEELRNTTAPSRSLYDPTCGTGGFLSVAADYIKQINPKASLNLYGQELNDESYAICKADMLFRNQNIENIKVGNTLTNDQHEGRYFDYIPANPPYGTKWGGDKELKEQESLIRKEAEQLGLNGRFGWGLPSTSDGQLLFLQHNVSHLRPVANDHKGGKTATVLNGGSLFAGDAGSGSSEIRKHLLQNDWVEAIVQLPTDEFYNTNISTYIWLINLSKPSRKKGKVQLIDASKLFERMARGLGMKRKIITAAHRDTVVQQFHKFANTEYSQIFTNTDFGYKVIFVEQPLIGRWQLDLEAVGRLEADSRYEKIAAEIKQDLLTTLLKSSRSFDTYKGAESWLKQQTYDDAATADSSQKMTKGKKLSAHELSILLDAMLVPDTRGEEGHISWNDPDDLEKGFVIDKELSDTEKVKLTWTEEEIKAYLDHEVKPYAVKNTYHMELERKNPKSKKVEPKIGYEINFAKYFAVEEEPRSLREIEEEIASLLEKLGSMS